ncbi:MAG: DNA-3-methyladenine glycosylase [Bacteroidetes bacterium]|nr:DNA-3-methyladenine glycosylase [Bacteroidota bacterium]
METKRVKLSLSFYAQEDVVQVSKDLLGKYLVTNFNDQLTSGIIVETEAYQGPEDKASHAYNNRRTNRTEIMYRQGGVAYVYLCYGIHHLFNVITGKEGVPHAVLIRAVEPTENAALMMKRRNLSAELPQLTAGPGVMSKAMGISTNNTGLSLVLPNSQIWIEDRGNIIASKDIKASPRVGVAYAEEWAKKNWRFRIKNSKWTSPAK